MGEILIGGMASLLICMFLGPKFISALREREFGQHIREEGPQGHHEKAGTPTMGGIIVFTAVAVPFLILTDRHEHIDPEPGRLLADLAVERARVRAELRHRAEHRQAALGGSLGEVL